MTSVYRIQDDEGRGPFRPGFSHRWSDEEFSPGMEYKPTWGEEFGLDLIKRKGRPGEYFGSAVRSIEKLRDWFSPRERIRLTALGFHVVCLPVRRILAESQHQVVFARNEPLNVGAVIVPWSALNDWSAPAKPLTEARP